MARSRRKCELSRLLADVGLTCQSAAHGRGTACNGLPGIHTRISRSERLHVYDALFQARAEAGDKVPLVAHRRDGCHWIAVMDFEDLLPILRESSRCQSIRQLERMQRGLNEGRAKAHAKRRADRDAKDRDLLEFWNRWKRAGESPDATLRAYAEDRAIHRDAVRRRAMRLDLIPRAQAKPHGPG